MLLERNGKLTMWKSKSSRLSYSLVNLLITKASESTNARFKRKKIRSMKRDFDKINEKLKESEKVLESVGPRVPRDPLHGGPLKLHPLNRNKHI